MYDCLGLALGRFESMLCNFNLVGGSLVLSSVGTPRPPAVRDSWWSDDTWRYPQAFLAAGTADALVDMMVARLGLPEPPSKPGSTPPSVSIAVLAELAKRHALAANAPEFRSGFFDSSGMAPSSPRAWIVRVPDVDARVQAANPGTIDAALVANRLWGVCTEGSDVPHVIVDLSDGAVVQGDEPQGSVWTRYRSGAGIRELAWWLDGLWRR